MTTYATQCFRVQDQGGRAIPNATVLVYDFGTDTPATIYSPSDPASPPATIPNPMLSDGNGFVMFATEAGTRVSVEVSGVGLATQVFPGLVAGGTSGAAGVTSLAYVAPAAGITISGTTPVTATGTWTFALADDLAALEGLAGTGWAKRTAANTWAVSATIPWTDISGAPATYAPSAHAASHASAGSDPVTLDQSQITGLVAALAAKQDLDTQLTSLAGLTYLGNALKVVRVNAGETDFELATPSGGAGTPGGADKQVQINDAGSFYGEAGFEYDKTTNQLTVPGATITEDLALTGDLTPAQITANQNDYNPASLATASVLRLSSDASRDITGLQGGSDGRVLALLNRGNQNIVLKHESASSTAAYRFKFPGSVDMTMIPGSSITLIYDATDSRWLPMTMLGTTGTLTMPTVVQHFSDTLGSDLTTTTTMSLTAPVITEGRNLISRTITPSRIGSKIIVRVAVESVHGSTCNKTVALFKDGAATRVAFATVASAGNYDISTCLTYVLTTTSLSSIAFELRAGANVGGTYTIKADSNMTIEEWDSAASFTMAPVGSAAPVDASYLMLGASASTSAERVFTPNTQQFTASDGGAGGNYTLKIGGIERISKTASYPIVAADLGSVIEMNAAGATTVTLPTAVGYEGKVAWVKNIGAGQISMASTGGQTLDGSTAGNAKIDQHQAKAWYSDGTNWKSLTGWMRRQVFTAGGTWTAPPGVTFCTVEAIGAGGGGGGALSSDAQGGAGGAAGERVIKTVSVTPGTGYTVTIGTAGAAGAATGGNGGEGGQTSFGTLVEAMGGTGGQGSSGNPNTYAMVSQDGTAMRWDGSAGGPSATPHRWGGLTNGSAARAGGSCAGFAGGTAGTGATGGGGGGASEYGAGGNGGNGGGTGAVGTAAAANTGAGGGGAGQGSTNRAGGAGGTGYMIVTWFE